MIGKLDVCGNRMSLPHLGSYLSTSTAAVRKNGMLRTVRNLILLLAVVLGLTGRGFAADTLLVITGAETQVSGAWDTGTITVSFTDSAGKTYTESALYGQFSTPASIASAFGAK